jgi:hypothetical protein
LTWPALFALAGVVVGSVSLYLGWRSAREQQLRVDQVLRWSNEVIRTLQTLWVVCYLGDRTFEDAEAKATRKRIIIDTSVLVEQGRMFFKNQPDDEHGKEKLEAYRGYRPALLDPIVVAHQIACRWDDADELTRQQMTLVAEDSAKLFVSMAQKEVGRSRTISGETAKGGTGDSLDQLIRKLDPARGELLSARPRKSL